MATNLPSMSPEAYDPFLFGVAWVLINGLIIKLGFTGVITNPISRVIYIYNPTFLTGWYRAHLSE